MAEILFSLELIVLALGFILILVASINLLAALRYAGYVIGGVIVFGALALMIVSSVYTNKYGRLTVPVNQYIEKITGIEQTDKKQEDKSISTEQEIQALRQQVQQQSQQIQQNSFEIQQNRETVRNVEKEQIENARKNASGSVKKPSVNKGSESKTGVMPQTTSIMTLINEQNSCSAKKCGVPKKGTGKK